MTQWSKTHQPCPCGKSSDAFAVATDGHGYCFSCGERFNGDNELIEGKNDSGFTYEYMDRRGISKETHEFFGVKTQINSDGKPVSVAYPHPRNYRQLRFLDPKDFRFSGTVVPGGYAYEKFPAGSAKAITITEGYDDAMSAWQMLGKYPVYSVRSSSTALSDVRADYDYLNSFEKIYLCLDDDDPGRRAANEIAAVFGHGKIFVVKNAPLKDAQQYLEAGRVKEFKNIWHNAKRWMPESVVSSYDDIDAIIDRASKIERIPWPGNLAPMQRMLGGIEIHRQVMILGLEGTGKTELLHETIAGLAKEQPDMNIGLCLLEEPIDNTVKIQVGKYLQRPVHLPGYEIPSEELKKYYRELTRRNDRLHFFHHFGSEETDVILSTIRFMVAACGCRVVFFDNYQHAVTGRTGDRNTEAMDYLAVRMQALVKELDFSLISISHENDFEQARGSRNLTKETDVWVHVKRNIAAENELERNMLSVVFKKNRQAQKTGPAGRLIYDVPTATLSEFTGELPT